MYGCSRSNTNLTVPSSLQVAELVVSNSLTSRTNEDHFNMDLDFKVESPSGFSDFSCGPNSFRKCSFRWGISRLTVFYPTIYFSETCGKLPLNFLVNINQIWQRGKVPCDNFIPLSNSVNSNKFRHNWGRRKANDRQTYTDKIKL